MNYEDKIKEYLKKSNGIITTAYCRENGIPTIYLTRLVDQGLFKQAAPGIYLAENGDNDELYFFQYRYKRTVYSYETALFLLGVTDKIIQKIDVTVSRNYKFNEKDNKINVHYVKKEWLDLGKIEAKTMFGNPVRAYSYERTLCDFVLHKEEIEPEVYVQAIRSYAQYEKRDIHLLYRIATEMGIIEKIREIIEITYE